MEHDYDEIFETRVSRPYARSKVGYMFGPVLICIGVVALVMTITDLYKGIYNLNPDSNFIYVWDENPIWPTYGKGFWVGLIFIATGVVGIISSCEHTIASIYSFAVLSAVSSVLGFYLIITASIPVTKLATISTSNISSNENNTLSLNSVLIAMGGFALIVGAISSVLSAILVGCCTDKRGYGAVYLASVRNPIVVGRKNITNPQ